MSTPPREPTPAESTDPGAAAPHPCAGDTAEAGAQAFFQAMHRAFDATLAATRGQPRLIDALLTQACDSFDGNVAIQCEDEPALACSRGCATCCSLRVGATAAEVFALARYVRRLDEPLRARGIDLVGRLRDVDARTRGLSEVQRVALNQPCAFVAQGVCVVYAVRPLACRGHACHDLQACIDAAAGRRAEVPYSVGHWMVRSLIQNAMQSALHRSGLAWSLYELHQALLTALDEPDAESRWLAGEDPLAAAALAAEAPAQDVVAVYDRLRPA